MKKLHVIGAGMAGLAAALRAASKGVAVVLYESAPQAGGRCRSYFDPALEREIDNGTHLILGAYKSLFAFLDLAGARDRLAGVEPAEFPFHDLETGRRWRLRPNRGLWPWWILMPWRRVPGTRAKDYLATSRLGEAAPEATVADILRGRLYERLWRPLCRAALNADPMEASAHLFGTIVTETLIQGEAASRPYLAPKGLSEALVEPALAALAAKGADIRFNAPCQGLALGAERIEALRFSGATVPLGPEEGIVLALPAWAACGLLPDLVVPDLHRAIVNAHFRPSAPPAFPWNAPFLGLLGGEAEWLFRRGDVLSVTASAADALAELEADEIAARFWRDMERALGPLGPLPPFRIVKERRATFAATPDMEKKRPGPYTRFENLLLAGDWTQTGLPATIEGAVRSGFRAADLALGLAPDARVASNQ